MEGEEDAPAGRIDGVVGASRRAVEQVEAGRRRRRPATTPPSAEQGIEPVSTELAIGIAAGVLHARRRPAVRHELYSSTRRSAHAPAGEWRPPRAAGVVSMSTQPSPRTVRRACTANRQRRRRQRVRATAGRRSARHSPRRAGGRERPTHLASSALRREGAERKALRDSSCRSARIEARPDQSRQTSRAPPPSAGYSPARAGPSST